MARIKKSRSVSGDEMLAQMAQWLEAQKRPAWKPVVKIGDSRTTASKFSGVPWLSSQESWPLCGLCKNPMHLFLQLDFGNLPRELDYRYGKGLFQFFFCTSENCWINAYGDHFSVTYLLRVVNPDQDKQRSRNSRFNDAYPTAFPARIVTRWMKMDDYPCFTEFGGLFEKSPFRVREGELYRVEHDGLGIVGEVAFDDYMKLDKCIEGDKLAGWPNWVQVHTEYPTCPQCATPMETIVFSLDSGDNIPFLFGDGGRGHIAQCSTHKNQFGFAWQSG